MSTRRLSRRRSQGCPGALPSCDPLLERPPMRRQFRDGEGLAHAHRHLLHYERLSAGDPERRPARRQIAQWDQRCLDSQLTGQRRPVDGARAAVAIERKATGVMPLWMLARRIASAIRLSTMRTAAAAVAKPSRPSGFLPVQGHPWRRLGPIASIRRRSPPSPHIRGPSRRRLPSAPCHRAVADRTWQGARACRTDG